MVNIELGEVVFGGVGSGLYGMLMFAVLAVFIAGLMVGRTPEYLGKKIEQKEVKMMMLSVLVLAFTILVSSGAGVVLNTVKSSLGNHGPHGLSEILYAYSSATGNNGSAFGGLSADTPYLDTTLGFAMLFGRFLMMIPLLAAAGSLAQKKQSPVSAGTFPTHGPLFVFLLVAVTLIVGALTFFPALSLGPIVEHFLMHQGKLWS
jgi:K+-transporting ATPase ATPase A chain